MSFSVEPLKGQSSEILILFFTYMDRHEYEPLWVLMYFKDPKDFRSEVAFFAQLKDCPVWTK